jgi:hypothetical protein
MSCLGPRSYVNDRRRCRNGCLQTLSGHHARMVLPIGHGGWPSTRRSTSRRPASICDTTTSSPSAWFRSGTKGRPRRVDVVACPGPTAPEYTCIGGREGYCPLVERADVVVLDPWLAGDEYGVGTSADDLVEVYASGGRTVILLGSVGWLEPFIGGHVVGLGERPDAGDVVAAVRTAPEADGFVFRGP